MKPTREYSAMLYSLASEIRREEGCVTESAERVDEAAERLDSQTITIGALINQRNELLAALEYHQEQTRPIQRSIDAIAMVKVIQHQTSAPAIVFFPAGSLGEEVERECCGTFFRTPHRSTCPKYRGKK